MVADASGLLNRAVHQNRLLSRRGLQERLFTLWFGGFVYNQIWEDPLVDADGLQLRPDSRVLTICSGGCNVLNYLVHRPESVTAVDLNRNHLHLTRLKLAALRHLPTHADFFRFFGRADDPENLANYRRFVREHLDPETRAHWDGGSSLRRAFFGARINYFARNLYDYSSLGIFLRFFHAFARSRRIDLTALLAARSREEQRAVFDERIAPFFEHWFIRGAARVPVLLFGLGVPPRQYETFREQTGGRVLDVYRERLRRLACDFPIADNYFSWQAFSRRYDHVHRRAVPDYLKESNYELLKRCAPRVRTELSTVIGWLRRQPAGAVDRIVLLDSQDWMKPGEIADQWAEIARVGRPGTRIIFRTGAAESPIDAALPRSLRRRFVYEEALSRDLFRRDRSAIYGGVHVYSKAD